MWKTEEVTQATFDLAVSRYDWKTIMQNGGTLYVENKSGRWLGEIKADGTYHLSEDIAPIIE